MQTTKSIFIKESYTYEKKLTLKFYKTNRRRDISSAGYADLKHDISGFATG